MMVTGSRPTYREDVDNHATPEVSVRPKMYEVFAVDGARMMGTTERRLVEGFILSGLVVLFEGHRVF